MSDHLISVSGEEVHIDESDGLQTSGVATAFEDNDDNDVALATIPGVLATRLNAITGTYANSSTANLIEAAVSDSEVITVNAGQSYDNLALTASDGTLLNNDPSGMTTTDDHDIRLYTDTTNDNIAYGVDSVTGLLVFVVYLEETAAGANIWVLMYDSVTQPDSPNNYDEAIDLTNKIYVTAFDENEFSLANAPPGDNLFMAFGDDQQAIVVTGKPKDASKRYALEVTGDGATVVAADDTKGMWNYALCEALHEKYPKTASRRTGVSFSKTGSRSLPVMSAVVSMSKKRSSVGPRSIAGWTRAARRWPAQSG